MKRPITEKNSISPRRKTSPLKLRQKEKPVSPKIQNNQNKEVRSKGIKIYVPEVVVLSQEQKLSKAILNHQDEGYKSVR